MEAVDGNESTYLGSGIIEASGEFSDDGDISDGTNMYREATMSSNNYDGDFEILQLYRIGRIGRANL